MSTRNVTIEHARYLELVEAEITLAALQAAGVDNWEGYGEVDWGQVEADVEAADVPLAGSQETTGAEPVSGIQESNR